MRNQWSETDRTSIASTFPAGLPAPVFNQLYATRLLGSEPDLALHGGGNTSVKCPMADLLGEQRQALFVKASGCDMAAVSAGDFVALDQERLNRLRNRTAISDEDMAAYFTTAQVRPSEKRPSIETLLHLFLPYTFIDHTHASPVLALTNRSDAAHCIREAFGTSVAVIPYTRAGLECALAAVEALRVWPSSIGLVIKHHGLVTWGATAKEAYDNTIKLVTLAETYLAGNRVRPVALSPGVPSITEARARYASIAPLLRGCLTTANAGSDRPRDRVVLSHIVSDGLLQLLAAPEAQAITVSTPLTPDYLIRTRRTPLFIEPPSIDDPEAFRTTVVAARDRYSAEYTAHLSHAGATSSADSPPPYPRVLLIPGIGAVCVGENAVAAGQVADITGQGLLIKQTIHETGGEYNGLPEEHLNDMEFRSYQRAKLPSGPRSPLSGTIVLVTGAAGAIGSGLCNALLEAGCHVAISDLPGEALDNVTKEFSTTFGAERIVSLPMDVTDRESVRHGFGLIAARFGGLDGVIVNAGIAHVSLLADMDLTAFQRLERVNIDGTLLTIQEAAHLFKLQATGGDIVLVSTKNVFSPGASFGAYSATKAAAHQLARIASLELAAIDVRVNMVAPDAVFSHGSHKSGLWATVGPGRMKSRGLDEAGLEEYYRQRNLLKAKVTARHVAEAALFFLSRRTPTTGATIPVDGGLPDATPR